ncbi:MAG: hypothetical protein H6686_02505 [Fibrobacteria bacterium]|nr:hypothetical protein [Fibrobacteria bacterium]
MIRGVSWIAGACAIGFAFLSVSCGNDSVAGKTTTTSNGGGKLLAIGPDGAPLADGIVLAARSWNPLTGKPGIVDTLRSDASGNITAPQVEYAFVQILDRTRTFGALVRNLSRLDDAPISVQVDSLHRIQARWPDRSGISSGRMFLDSSFSSTRLRQGDDSFILDKVPKGSHELMLDTGASDVRPMGSIALSEQGVRYTGSGNILLKGDSTGSPLWIDDFEAGRIWPMLRPSHPEVSPWFMWWTETEMSIPASTSPADIGEAIGEDTLRGGRTFRARFTTIGSNAEIAAGITNLELDLRDRREVCLGYRSDAAFKIEFQRDSVAGLRPNLTATLPMASQWRDTCASTASFLPSAETPDSLATWNTFAKRVLVIQFMTSTGATFLELDDIRLR